MLHMVHWLYTYVASVCFSCFKRMLQVFLSRFCICCSVHTHMLQAFVVNIFIYFGRMLQQMLFGASVSSTGAARGASRGGPLWRSCPHVCVGSQAGRAGQYSWLANSLDSWPAQLGSF